MRLLKPIELFILEGELFFEDGSNPKLMCKGIKIRVEREYSGIPDICTTDEGNKYHFFAFPTLYLYGSEDQPREDFTAVNMEKKRFYLHEEQGRQREKPCMHTTTIPYFRVHEGGIPKYLKYAINDFGQVSLIEFNEGNVIDDPWVEVITEDYVSAVDGYSLVGESPEKHSFDIFRGKFQERAEYEWLDTPFR